MGYLKKELKGYGKPRFPLKHEASVIYSSVIQNLATVWEAMGYNPNLGLALFLCRTQSRKKKNLSCTSSLVEPRFRQGRDIGTLTLSLPRSES